MFNKKGQINISSYLGIFFLILILVIFFIKDMIYESIIAATGGEQIEESRKVSKETAELLLSLDKITLDTKVLSSGFLQSLIQLPVFPIDAKTLTNFGKVNPFLGNFVVVPSKASSTVGSVIYSNQRAVNGGESLRPVSTNRR